MYWCDLSVRSYLENFSVKLQQTWKVRGRFFFLMWFWCFSDTGCLTVLRCTKWNIKNSDE